MEQCVDEASIIIRNTKEPTLTLKVILTSPLIRDELEKKDAGTYTYIYLFYFVCEGPLLNAVLTMLYRFET